MPLEVITWPVIVNALQGVFSTGGSTPATAETQAAYQLEQSRRVDESMWDQPFGEASPASLLPSGVATATPVAASPGQLPTAGTPQAPTAPALPIAAAPTGLAGAPPGPAVPYGLGDLPGPSQTSALFGLSSVFSKKNIKRLRALERRFYRSLITTRPTVASRAGGTVLRRVGLGLGGIGAIAAGLSYSKAIAPGTLSAEERRENELRYAFQQTGYARKEHIDEQMRRLGTPFQDPEPTAFGRRVLDTAGDFGREWLAGQLEKLGLEQLDLARDLQPVTVAARPLPMPALGTRIALPGASAPQSQTVTPAGPVRRVVGRINPSTLRNATLAGLGIGLLQRRRRDSAPVIAQETRSAPAPGPGMGAIQSPSTIYLTGVETRGVSSTASRTCSCAPKRRGPRRKCLERGSVAWRSGRYKGRAAGTKCIRWET